MTPAPKRGSRTPWGAAQYVSVTELTDCYYVGTAGHGGYKVTGALWRAMRRDYPALAALADGAGWFEEDCAASAVQCAYPALCSLQSWGALEHAHQRCWDHFPDAYAATFHPRDPVASRTLRQRAWLEAHPNAWHVCAAFGSDLAGRGPLPPGYVGVQARRGAQSSWWLVPRTEYRARGEFGYVLPEPTPTDHLEWRAT